MRAQDEETARHKAAADRATKAELDRQYAALGTLKAELQESVENELTVDREVLHHKALRVLLEQDDAHRLEQFKNASSIRNLEIEQAVAAAEQVGIMPPHSLLLAAF